MNVVPDRLLYSRREAARMLNISLRSLDHLLSVGSLDSVQMGRRRLISKHALECFAGVGVRQSMQHIS
jgi:excisionase family DNA binding protein